MVSGFAKAMNDLAPHVVIPKIVAGFTAGLPKPTATETVESGGACGTMSRGSGLSGIRERRAVREGDSGLSAMESKLAQDRKASQESGFSMTGDTIIF